MKKNIFLNGKKDFKQQNAFLLASVLYLQAMTNLLDIYKMHQLEFCKNDKASGQELDILLYCFAEIR